MTMESKAPPKMIRGIPVSPGINRGSAYVITGDSHFAVPHRAIVESEIKTELDRFQAALGEAERELLNLQKDVEEKIGMQEAAIFDAQILVLKDPGFLKEVTFITIAKKVNIEAALVDVIEKFSKMFAEIDDVYMRERASDIRDVGRRVLSILIRHQRGETFVFPEGVIVVADELLPSTTAHMDLRKVRGIIMERGGKTSHASILARSLGIPAIIGTQEATHLIKDGTPLIVDGISGAVFINPKRSVLQEYVKLESDFRAYQKALKDLIVLPAETRDGTKIKLCANIGKLADAEAAFLFKADGIGLYRTEFTFFIRDEFPSEEEQYDIYRTVAERMHPRQVLIRTLDIGSDKMLPYFPLAQCKNPSLGERGIRLLLKYPDIFRVQLRAILRVSGQFPAAILLPMVSSVEEVIAAKKIIAEVKDQLREEGIRFNTSIPLGVMIEVPSAALTVKAILKEVDCLSIGTNDLIQYLLSADRASQQMTSYYEPLHPSVLKMIQYLVQAGAESGKDVTLCGEMAGDPALVALLLGLGVRHLSVAPGEILEVKKAIRAADITKAAELARQVLTADTVAEVHDYIFKQAPHFTASKIRGRKTRK